MAEQQKRSRRKGLTGREAIERVKSDFPEMLGRPIEAVLGLEQADDNGWKVVVSVVEMGRIPPTTDILGAYAITLDSDGELAGYRRERRYHRNQADED